VTCSPLTSDLSFPSVGIRVDMFNRDCNRSPSPTTSSSDDDDDDDSDDEDEDEYNVRVAPHWQAYRHLFESRGYHLDTCKDVRQFYLRYWETRNVQHSIQSSAGYSSASREDRGDNDLCKDEGLVGFSFLPRFLFADWHLPIAGPLAVIPVLRSAGQIRLRDYDGGRLITISFPVAGPPVPR
jgi:hypothetical protein